MKKPQRKTISDLSLSFERIQKNHKKKFWGKTFLQLGDFDVSKKNVGVIGTRRPSPYGRLLVEDLLANLSNFDVNILSGGALGIDAMVHRCALQRGLQTSAWLVGPVESPNPGQHHALFRQMLSHAGNALFFPEALLPQKGRPVQKSYWLQRNLWLAAHCDLLIVVEALERSGTWSTVKAANEFGVPVFGFPGPLYSPASKGPNLMISEGYAHPIVNFAYLKQRIVDELGAESYNRVKRQGLGALGRESPERLKKEPACLFPQSLRPSSVNLAEGGNEIYGSQQFLTAFLKKEESSEA